jgi:membrane-bound lytic murein transglycosylase
MIRTGRVALVLVLVALAAGCSASRGGSASRAIGSDVDDDFGDATTLALAAWETAEALERGAGPLGAAERAELVATAKVVEEIATGRPSPQFVTAALAKRCRTTAAATPARATAYYEPVLRARRTHDERYRYPLYAMPSAEQLATLQQKLGRMPTRADIDGSGVLDGLGLEIAWLADPVDRFFLQIQGSGRLQFDDGSERAFAHAGTNGAEYRSVGTEMLERGLVKSGETGAEQLKAWLKSHPSERDAILFANPRYGFFVESDDGLRGALDAGLTAYRSVAVDPAEIPLGSALWLRTSWPVLESGRVVGRRTSARVVFAQDTGAAIRGAGRVDVFVGSGAAAGVEAGSVDERGELWLLRCR